MNTNFFEFGSADSPLLITAIHDGHDLRNEIAEVMVLKDEERLREEDPYTSRFINNNHNYLVVKSSRFEVDVNRPRNKAVYKTPSESWGLKVWKENLSEEIITRSMDLHDNFYREIKGILTKLEKKFGCFIVYDIHSYNYKRNGIGKPEEPAVDNPEINVGTASLNKNIWNPLLENFIKDLKSFDYFGRQLDVRENVKFKGGYFSEWIHKNFPDSGCALAIEFKKIFMNEWTGEVYDDILLKLKAALHSTIPGTLRLRENICRNIKK
jgi:N-formylglutamate deformylase